MAGRPGFLGPPAAQRFRSYGRQQQPTREPWTTAHAAAPETKRRSEDEDRHSHQIGAYASGGPASRGRVQGTYDVADRAEAWKGLAARELGTDRSRRAVSPATRSRRHRGSAGLERGTWEPSNGPPPGLTNGRCTLDPRVFSPSGEGSVERSRSAESSCMSQVDSAISTHARGVAVFVVIGCS